MQNMEPATKDRKKFDIDLSYGKVSEQMVADMLQDKKIEVKSERDMWMRTGNIAIEYESYGKPSGIAMLRSLTTGSTTCVLVMKCLPHWCLTRTHSSASSTT